MSLYNVTELKIDDVISHVTHLILNYSYGPMKILSKTYVSFSTCSSYISFRLFLGKVTADGITLEQTLKCDVLSFGLWDLIFIQYESYWETDISMKLSTQKQPQLFQFALGNCKLGLCWTKRSGSNWPDIRFIRTNSI